MAPYRRNIILPKALATHRVVTNVEGVDATLPANNHSDWDDHEGYQVVRVYAAVTFTGGTNPSLDFGVYVRQRDAQSTPVLHVARAPAPDSRWETGTLRVTGADNVAFDTILDGDDFLVLVESVQGSPAAWAVTFRYSLR